MKELKAISMESVKKLCVEQKWYTCGDIEAYCKMLSFVQGVIYASVDDLEKIATDIKEHSDTTYKVADIMYFLANRCCLSYFE